MELKANAITHIAMDLKYADSLFCYVTGNNIFNKKGSF